MNAMHKDRPLQQIKNDVKCNTQTEARTARPDYLTRPKANERLRIHRLLDLICPKEIHFTWVIFTRALSGARILYEERIECID